MDKNNGKYFETQNLTSGGGGVDGATIATGL